MNLTQIKDKIVEIKNKLPHLPRISKKLQYNFKFAVATALPVVLAITVTTNAADNNAVAEDAKLVASMSLNLEDNIFEQKANKVEIIVGESDAERIAREANASQTKLASASTVSTTATVVEGEPSLEEKRAIVQEVAAKYNIDWKLLEAVWQVESGKRWNTSAVSSAGALGPMQFLSGTWRAYGVDGNGDGTADVFNPIDALHGGANYLAANGADQGDIDNALFCYNHSSAYVAKVKSIMNSI